MTACFDPTAEAASDRRAPLVPPSDLRERTIGLLDIGKMRGDEFVDKLDELMTKRGYRLKRWKKPTNTLTAPLPILKEISDQAAAVIIALSDCRSCTSCSTHDLNDLDHRGVTGAFAARFASHTTVRTDEAFSPSATFRGIQSRQHRLERAVGTPAATAETATRRAWCPRSRGVTKSPRNSYLAGNRRLGGEPSRARRNILHDGPKLAAATRRRRHSFAVA